VRHVFFAPEENMIGMHIYKKYMFPIYVQLLLSVVNYLHRTSTSLQYLYFILHVRVRYRLYT